MRTFFRSSGFGQLTGTGAAEVSPSSRPCITSNRIFKSVIVRAIGPTTPSSANGPTDSGKCPVAGMRPGVGFRPQIPVKWAGTRIEPPPSLPTPPAEHLEAMAADSPPLEPPDVRERSQGLFVRPYRRLSVSQAISSSGVLVTPNTMAPAAFSRDTSTASCEAMHPARRRVPASQRSPATAIELFRLMGTPCSGPSGSPIMTACSAARACCRALFAST